MGEKMPGIKITGMSFYVPDQVITNNDIEKKYGISAEWIEQVTGIKSRHTCAPHEACSDLGIAASKLAIKKAGINASEIDLIILASVGPDYSLPPTSSIIQDKIQAKNAAAFDIEVACLGFVWGVNIAAQFISNDVYKNVLVIASEPATRAANYEDKNTFILLGDGAAAAILTKSNTDSGILSSYFRTDGKDWDAATILGGGSRHPKFYEDKENIGKYFFSMNGRKIYKFAVNAMNEAIEKVIQKAKLDKNKINLVVPHQANHRILQSAIRRSGIPKDKYFINVDKFGNTSAASIPIALAEAEQKGRIKDGDYVIMVGFGAGLNWGAMLVKW